jgi:2-polyprenyl-3-methyl-5-hydroxy-6-metoxy-1,4-benzoquinol methylase
VNPHAAGPDPLRAAVGLGVSLDALAALAAYLRIESEGLPVDPVVRDLLEAITREVLDQDQDDAGSAVASGQALAASAGQVVALARAFLRQAGELVENPGRSGAWDEVDVALLQSIGRLSMGIAGAVRAAEATLPGLGERLAAPGARILDVGTGVGWLTIALAQTYSQAIVVGIDVFAPALDLARANVAQSGVGERVWLRLQDAADLDEESVYDVVWLPMPFLPKSRVPDVVQASVRALRPGGWVLAGTFAGPDGVLAQLVTELRTVRSGGYPWRPEEILGLLAEHGLQQCLEIPRSWPAPLRLYAGTQVS